MTVKNFSALLIFLATIFIFVSCDSNCEGNECYDFDESSDYEEEKEFRVRVIGHTCNQETVHQYSLDNVGSLTVSIDSVEGANLFRKSFTRSEISSSMKLSGIDSAEKAVLTISGFDVNNPNEIKWEGKVDNLTFKKGQKTAVDIILYPKSGKGCLPEPLNIPRFGHVSTLLPDGRILLTGGFSQPSGKTWMAGKTVEIIDVESGVIEQLADMNEERAMHEVVVLPDGSVLIFGGVRQLEVGNRPIEGYPDLPYSFLVQATTVEKYMPQYPKRNMRNNKIGTEILNQTQIMNLSFTEMPFLQYQSYVVDDSNPAKITVYMVGGLNGSASAGLTPSDKIYAFDIVDTGIEYTLSAVREIAAGEKDPSIMPAAGVYQGSLFTVGGRGNDAGSLGSVYTQSGATDWGDANVPNFFFSASYMLGETLYIFGGLRSSDGSVFDQKKNPAYSFRMLNGSYQESENNHMSFGDSLLLSDVVYNQKNNQFLVIGGAGGEGDMNKGNKLLQVVDITPFKVHNSAPSYTLKFDRVLPKGTIDHSNRLFITGGASSLNPDGTIINAVEIDSL
jgi:hypothetical protein